MLVYHDKILLFGGIHDIAHEKNDILFFNCASEKWSKIEEDSTKRPQEQLSARGNYKKKTTILREDSEPKFLATSREKLHNKKTSSNFFLKTGKIHRDLARNSVSPQRRSIFFNKSLGSANNSRNLKELKDERVRKEKNMKKMMLLSEFEVSEAQRKEFVVHSPTTELMKNSINTIKIERKNSEKNENFKGNFEKNSKGFGEKNVEKNKPILNVNEKKVNLIKGKKPCARDGCSANVYKEKVVIFGGDRHLMTFHDMFFLNLKLAFEENF